MHRHPGNEQNLGEEADHGDTKGSSREQMVLRLSRGKVRNEKPDVNTSGDDQKERYGDKAGGEDNRDVGSIGVWERIELSNPIPKHPGKLLRNVATIGTVVVPEYLLGHRISASPESVGEISSVNARR